MLDRITNGILRRDYDFVIDPSCRADVHQTPLIESESQRFLSEGFTKTRRQELLSAFHIVVRARNVFEMNNPKCPDDHRHFVVVKLSDLEHSLLHDDRAQTLLNLSPREAHRVVNKLRGLLKIPTHPFRRRERANMLKSFQQETKRLIDTEIKKEEPSVVLKAVRRITSIAQGITEEGMNLFNLGASAVCTTDGSNHGTEGGAGPKVATIVDGTFHKGSASAEPKDATGGAGDFEFSAPTEPKDAPQGFASADPTDASKFDNISEISSPLEPEDVETVLPVDASQGSATYEPDDAAEVDNVSAVYVYAQLNDATNVHGAPQGLGSASADPKDARAVDDGFAPAVLKDGTKVDGVFHGSAPAEPKVAAEGDEHHGTYAMKYSMKEMLLEIKRKWMSSKPNETVVSFSDFLQALRIVCAQRCYTESRLESFLGQDGNADIAYNEYLH
jgi:hypothetical protein